MLPTLRCAVLTCLSLLCAPVGASAQAVSQPIDVRQICGARELLDAPAGNVVAHAEAGTPVTVLDFGFGPDGRTYYRSPQGYVASQDAPHFCIRPDEGAFRAPPNTCHLIAASRRTLPEVNEFAREYPAYLPTMMAYRASNGWYAISLGVVTLTAFGPLSENAEGLPDDVYCADGTNYIAAMDQRWGIFSDVQDSPDAQCLTGDRAACAQRAEEFAKGEDYWQALRFWMLACMGGDFASCGRPIGLTPAYYDHAMLTAVPDLDYRLGIARDLARTACDAGSAQGCLDLAGREIQFGTDTPPEYLTALQAVTAGCIADDDPACNAMFRMMERREQAMQAPVPAEDWYQVAQLRADTCAGKPRDVHQDICNAVYRANAAFAEMAAPDDPRAQQARDYLHAACQAGAANACPPPTADEEFQRLVFLCQTQEDRDGADACSSALSYYARHISATQVDALVSALEAVCTPDRIAGCATLAFVQGPNTLTGENLTFHGKDQPEKRLLALQTGCRPGPMGQANCRDLGQLQEQRGEYIAARDAYRTACDTIKADSAVALYSGGHSACFDAGLLALRKLDDTASARSYFEFVCNDPNQTDARYACKHLGLMETDDAAAFALFQRACYPVNQDRGDGEGCLLYAEMLRENRDNVGYGFEGDLPSLAGPPPDAQARATTDQLASHAYANGCISRWTPACTAGEAFNAALIGSDNSGMPAPCQIRSQGGQVVADRTCRRIAFFETAEAEFDERTLVTAELYVWPDGDRTLLQQRDGYWRLNGAFADVPWTDDEMQCVTRNDTGNSFCFIPPPM